MDSPKVMIVIPRKAVPATSQFDLYFDQLDLEGLVPLGITKPVGQSPARNRNIGIEQALNHGFTHIFFVDDDVLLPKDALKKLLAHKKDIVSGLYLMRSYPHRAIAFSAQDSDGLATWQQLKPDVDGLIEIQSAGLGCCLINTQIFMKMEKPWIRLGEIELDHWCDDLGFFNRAKRLGYRLYLDTSVKCGHVAEIAVWPDRVDDKWMTVYNSVGGEGTAMIPQFYIEK